jgi:hypothetical protein
MWYVVQTHGHFYLPKHHMKYTHLDLPHGALDNNDWQKKFILTYEKWLGACVEPWLISKDPNHISALQAIWNAVYPHIDHVIDMDSPVYHIVSLSVSILSLSSFQRPIGQPTCLSVAAQL